MRVFMIVDEKNPSVRVSHSFLFNGVAQIDRGKQNLTRHSTELRILRMGDAYHPKERVDCLVEIATYLAVSFVF